MAGEMTVDERFAVWDGTFRRMGLYPLFDSELGVLILVPDQGDLRQRAMTVAALAEKIRQHAVNNLYPAAEEAARAIGAQPVQPRQGNGQAQAVNDPGSVAAIVAQVMAAMGGNTPRQPSGPEFEAPAERATDIPPSQRRRRARKEAAEGEGRDLGRQVTPKDPRALTGSSKQSGIA